MIGGQIANRTPQKGGGSRQGVFYNKSVLKTQSETLRWEPATYQKRDSERVLFCEFGIFLGVLFLTEYLMIASPHQK